MAVDENPARRRIVKTRDQTGDRGLAHAGRSDQGQCLSGPDPEIDILEDHFPGIVAKGKILKTDLPLGLGERDGPGLIPDVGLGVEDFEDPVRAGQ